MQIAKQSNVALGSSTQIKIALKVQNKDILVCFALSGRRLKMNRHLGRRELADAIRSAPGWSDANVLGQQKNLHSLFHKSTIHLLFFMGLELHPRQGINAVRRIGHKRLQAYCSHDSGDRM